MSSSFNLFRAPALALALGGTLSLAGCAPAISTQEEVQVGAQNAAQISQQLPIVQDAAINQYVNQIGTSISSRADPRGIPYHFFVVNSSVVNAFSIPGGYVYVNRGLVDRASNASELAGVLGHEIGHVVERHGIEQWQRAQNANTGLALLYGVLLGRNPGTLEQVGIQAVGSGVLARYSRDDERQADADGVQFTMRAGYNPNGMVTFFQKLLGEQQGNPSALQQWFSTHPLTQERITSTRQMVSAIPAAQLRGLTTDTQAFQNFKARVRSLPAPPRGQ
ncbi:MAG: M48 family metalloprotease [Gemmatimonadetes bacterium]|nr:M48 family metalloprotease [Gemmatimonadota bacterium]